MTGRAYNVLFLCTGNSARSILAESILKKDGAGRFNAFSAGSQPKGSVHPFALKVLEAMNYPTDGFRSKSWDEFAAPGAPEMDFVFTVCDSAAGEACPIWPGNPMTAHWGIEDPAAVEGSDIERERAFSTAARYMRNRIHAFLNLPLAAIDRLAMQRHLRRIGTGEGVARLTLEVIDGSDAGFQAALVAADLPIDDLLEPGRSFFSLSRGGTRVAFGGFELLGDNALLRSIVVLPAYRGRGIGEMATEALLERARLDGARRAYLLTTTAAPFFEELGFTRIERAEMPEAMLATRQASALCPQSAAVFEKALGA